MVEAELPLPADAIGGLDGIELVRVRLPLRHPFESAHGVERARDVVLVRAVGHDGVEGWGECSALEAPTYTGEYTDGAWAVLRDHLVPAALACRFDHVRGHPMATAAVELALTDLTLRREGRSLVSALGGPHGEPITWTLVMGTHRTLAELVDAIEDVIDDERDDPAWSWFPSLAVKLKIAPGSDLYPVRMVRHFWPGLRVHVDANGSYTRADTGHLRELASRLGPGAYLEQPLAAGDLLGHAELARRLDGREVALDESIASVYDVRLAAALGAASVVNLKPARVGGLRASLEVVRAARRVDRPMHVFVGGMLETGIGRATVLAVAASTAVGATEIDLGPSSHYFEDDVTEPIELGADRSLTWLDRPGIGVAPRPERLREVVVDRLLIRP